MHQGGNSPSLETLHDMVTEMGSNLPRRNHVIAQMLLRNFVDDSQYLHILNKKKINPYKSKPRKAFVDKRRYVRYRDGGTQDDYEVEKKLSEIEGDAAPAIRRIIACARRDEFPILSAEWQRAWKRFFFTSVLRAPEHAARILSDLGSEQALDEAITRVIQEAGLPLPEEELYISDPQWANIRKMARHNNIATFAAGLPHQVNSELESYSQRVGLLIGVIQDPRNEFIIGSCAAVEIVSKGADDLTTGMWLPISYDVAIGLTAFPDREYLRSLGQVEVQRINNASFEQSQIVAARSKRCLRQFMQRASKSQVADTG